MKHPILYVDDEEINLYIFEMLLEGIFDVYKAVSAHEAFEILEKNPKINLIVTDWSMPVMDGLTFAKEVSNRFNEKKVMMLSAYVKTDEIEKSIENRILIDYLSKPLNRESFLDRLSQLGY